MLQSNSKLTRKSSIIVWDIHPIKSMVFFKLNKGAIITDKNNQNKIIDAYPLFHSPIVNPTLGVALDLI